MSTSTATTTTAAGLVTGTWDIDPSHSEVAFSVRHLMVSKVRGTFSRFQGAIEVADDELASSVVASIEVDSVDTRDAGRDAHLRSADFFDAANHPTMEFRSTGVRAVGDGYVVDGELSLRGVTRPVSLELELNGTTTDPWGGTRAGFSATSTINRRDFGVTFDIPGDSVVVGDKVGIHLEIEAVLRSPDTEQ
jgi:polyisoprenoid-binding protein YceI